ncbi:hypothetical protein SY88_16315 [Clostridiales bacterium PH28_bin88]|nr:hypothetical protein SY88_16315 [Clostridiales bacterium PH28_bin88]
MCIAAVEAGDQETLEALKAHKEAAQPLVEEIKSLREAKVQAWEQLKAAKESKDFDAGLDALRRIVQLKEQINEKLAGGNS